MAVLAGCPSAEPTDGGAMDASAADNAVPDTSSDGGATDASAADSAAPDTSTGEGTCAMPFDAGPVPDAGPFAMGPHAPLPRVQNLGGPIIPHVQLVTISFANDPNRDLEENYARWVAGSDWLRTVGAEYGVGTGTFLGAVRLPNDAPRVTFEHELTATLAQGITAGTIPRPADGSLANVLYVVYYPRGTVAQAGDSGFSCEEWRAYHDQFDFDGTKVAFAAVADCGGDTPMSGANSGRNYTETDYLQISVSHEILEALTNPAAGGTGAAWWLEDDGSPGATFGLYGGREIGDLCAPFRLAHQNGFVVQRMWSNAAAETGDPCVPADPCDPYYNTSAWPTGPTTVPPGGTVTYNLQGWSNRPMADWQLTYGFGPNAGFRPTLHFSTERLNNGGTATLQVTVPNCVTPGDSVTIYLFSMYSQTEFHVWPLVVHVSDGPDAGACDAGSDSGSPMCVPNGEMCDDMVAPCCAGSCADGVCVPADAGTSDAGAGDAGEGD